MYSVWFPNAFKCFWFLQFWKKGCCFAFTCFPPAVPTACRDLCGSCFHPTGKLLTCIKLCGAEGVPEKPWCSKISNHFRRLKICLCPSNSLLSRASGEHLSQLCSSTSSPSNPLTHVQDTQGRASDVVLEKHHTVVLDYAELQMGWGRMAPSEVIYSAPCSGPGQREQVAPGCAQLGF